MRVAEEQDGELFDTWMPAPQVLEKKQGAVAEKVLVPGVENKTRRLESLLGKRGLADISSSVTGQKIPKKSKSSIPALASFRGVDDLKAQEDCTKKALMTRELLRKGINDPKGLLEL